MVRCAWSNDKWQCPLESTDDFGACHLHHANAYLRPNHVAELKAYVDGCVSRDEPIVLDGMHIGNLKAILPQVASRKTTARSTHFHRRIQFSKLQFQAPLILRDALFYGYLKIFDCAMDVLDAQGAKFRGTVRLRRSKFLGTLQLAGSSFESGPEGANVFSIVGCEFNHGLLLEGADLGAQFRIERSIVRKTFHARGTRFRKHVVIFDCQFEGHFQAYDADFERGIVFRESRLSDEATFKICRVQKRAVLEALKFLKCRASFEGTVFDADTSLSAFYVDPKSTVDFARVDFQGSLLVEGWQFSNSVPNSVGTRVLFSRVSPAPDSYITFRAGASEPLDLTRFCFVDTDVSNYSFGNVSWAMEPAWLNSRQKLLRLLGRPIPKISRVADEDRLPALPGIRRTPMSGTSVDPHALADLYARLRTSYDRAGNHRMAGQFHVREMEMRRISLRPPYHSNWAGSILERFFLNLYRIFGLYGESYLRPLSWILLLLAIAWRLEATDYAELAALARIFPAHSALVVALDRVVPWASHSLSMTTIRLAIVINVTLLLVALRRQFRRPRSGQ